MVSLTCPDSAQALKIAESFGTAVVDSDGIRDLHERLIVETADSLAEGLGEKAMQIHLQRIVGAYVGSAHGAGQFYSRAVTEARDATAKASNDVRDEDLDGPSATTAPHSASASSPPTWVSRLMRSGWQPRALSGPTNGSSARLGSPSIDRSKIPVPISIVRRPSCKWPPCDEAVRATLTYRPPNVPLALAGSRKGPAFSHVAPVQWENKEGMKTRPITAVLPGGPAGACL